MRYQGRLEFPDENAADVVVSVEVTDTHVRLASGDESLGSWCLADVVAERVVANEFLLDLQGEPIRFIADDPVNFAYGAVQGMAEGWARYHSMNPVSRKRAVSAARRKNDPSRLADARRVFVAAGARLLPDPEPVIEPAADPLVQVVESPPLVEAAVETPVEVEAPLEEVTPAVDEPVVAPDPEPPAPAPESGAGGQGETAVPEPVPAQAAVVAGRLRRLNAFPTPKPAVGEVAAEAVGEEDAVAEPGHPPRRSRRQRHVAVQPPIEAAVSEDAPETPEPDPVSPEVDPAAVAPEDITEIVLPGADEADLDPMEAPAETADSRFTPVSRTAWRSPDAVKAPVEVAPSPSPRQSGAFKDGHHPAETTGLRATVKSMFGRQSRDHEHSFVESTTAVGLTRRVCLECGHVSIGVSD